jgi:hypothetical protein
MSELSSKRTLVKSPPELWAEVSDLEALARHLGEFGEIRITRLEPETTVVWEGDRACGTVKLEPSGWGTKVTLTAALEEEEPEAPAEILVIEEDEPEAVVEDPPPSPALPAPEPEPAPELSVPGPAPKRGFWARLFGRRVPPPEPPEPPAAEVPVEEPEPEPEPIEEPPPEPPAPLQPVPDPEPPEAPAPDDPPPAAQIDDDRAVAVLTEVLDNLGSAHHRPFSRG